MTALVDVIIDHAADLLEDAGGDLDCLSEEIFGTQTPTCDAIGRARTAINCAS